MGFCYMYLHYGSLNIAWVKIKVSFDNDFGFSFFIKEIVHFFFNFILWILHLVKKKFFLEL